jgi:hypothetical protein
MASSMMPMSKKVQHAGMVDNTFVCNRCGSRYELALPMPIFMLTASIKAWEKEHAKCKGNTSAIREAKKLVDWPSCDDTGISSRAIYAHMTGRRPQSSTFGNHPHDPSDFGRCYRLLQLAPEWVPRMVEMAQYTQVWARLAEVWPELTRLYEEELPAGTCPRLYARMKDLGA